MSHPVTWVPGTQERHASTDKVPGPGREFPAEVTVSTVCGREVTSATGDLPWLWPTCPDCDDEARRLVGVPGRAEIDARSSSVVSGDRCHGDHHHSRAPQREGV